MNNITNEKKFVKPWALLVVFLFYFSPSLTQAVLPPDVVINEIAWMGTIVSPNDEWIELYNNTENPINLDGWQLVAQDGTPKINLSGTISSNGFYLLERTDDTTVPNIPADQIYTGALGNSGENLKLYDNSNNVIDGVDCSAGWFAGLGKPEYKTMERINPPVNGNDSSNWQKSENPGGTPKVKNSVVGTTLPEPEAQPQPEPQPEPNVEESKPISYPSGIVINEILPSPIGPDETEEWVEIFNQNNFEIDLLNWQIIDVAGKITTYAFQGETKISPNGYLVLSRPTTKITLNNDNDGLNLIQPDGKIVDSVSYEKAPRGQSYNRTELGWLWSSTLSPESTNVIPVTQVAQSESEKEKSETQFSKTQEPQVKKGLAAVGEQIPKTSKTLYVFLIALSIAIFSGIIILIIKRKIKQAI